MRKLALKSLFTLIILSIILSNIYNLFSALPAQAAYPEPTFQFKEETWQQVETNKITHTLPFKDSSGKSHKLEFDYTDQHGKLQALTNYGFSGKTVNVHLLNRVYRLDGQRKELDLNPIQNTRYHVITVDPVSGETRVMVGAIVYNMSCGTRPEYYLQQTDQNIPYCFNSAKGGDDSLYGWYLKKTAERLAKGTTYLGDEFSSWDKPDKIPSECKAMLIKPASSDDFGPLDELAKEMGLEQSPFRDKEKDLALYKKFYATDPNVTTSKFGWSDRHINYADFLNEYHDAEIGLVNFWKEGEGENGLSEKLKAYLSLKGLAAGTVGLQGLKKGGTAVIDKLAAGRYSKFWSTWKTGANVGDVAGRIRFGQAINNSNFALLIGTMAVTATDVGIDIYKNGVNTDSWKQMFEMLTARNYAAAHLGFHECMVKNKVKGGGFTQKILDEELEKFQTGDELVDELLADFIGYQKELDEDDPCASAGWSTDTVTHPVKSAILGTLCVAVEAVFGLLNWFYDKFIEVAVYSFRDPPPSLAITATTLALGKPAIAEASNEESLSYKLNPAVYKQDNGEAFFVVTAWRYVRSFINLFLILALILIAFANIFHINIDTYAVKKSLPGLVLGVILANLSLFICRALIDAAQVLTAALVGTNDWNAFAQEVVGAVGFWKVGFAQGLGIGATILSITLIGAAWPVLVFGLVLIIILYFAPLIAFAILAFMLLIRIAMIYFLVSVAPLAFVSLGLPMTTSLFKQWWTNMLKWVFMLPAVFFILRLAVLFGDSANGQPNFFQFVIVVALVYGSFLIPFKLGGSVMNIWWGLGKKTGLPLLKWGGRSAMAIADKEAVRRGRTTPWMGYQGWVEKGNKEVERTRTRGKALGGDLRTRFGLGQRGYETYLAQQSLDSQAVKELGDYDRDRFINIAASIRGRTDTEAVSMRRAIYKAMYLQVDDNELIKAVGDAQQAGNLERRNNLLEFIGYSGDDAGWGEFTNEIRHAEGGIGGMQAEQNLVCRLTGRTNRDNPTEEALDMLGWVNGNAPKVGLGWHKDLVIYDATAPGGRRLFGDGQTHTDPTTGRVYIEDGLEHARRVVREAGKEDPQGFVRNASHRIMQVERDAVDDGYGTRLRPEATPFALAMTEGPGSLVSEGLIPQGSRIRPRMKETLLDISGDLRPLWMGNPNIVAAMQDAGPPVRHSFDRLNLHL